MTRLERINAVINDLNSKNIDNIICSIVNDKKDYIFHLNTSKGTIYTSGKKINDPLLARFNAVVTNKGVTYYEKGKQVNIEQAMNIEDVDTDYLPF